MTPKQDMLVDQFFKEVVPPVATEPFYFDQDDFEALRAMWEEHKALQDNLTVEAGAQVGAIGFRGWAAMGRELRRLTDPQPNYREEVSEYIDRVGPPVMAALKVEMPKYLPSRGVNP